MSNESIAGRCPHCANDATIPWNLEEIDGEVWRKVECLECDSIWMEHFTFAGTQEFVSTRRNRNK